MDEHSKMRQPYVGTDKSGYTDEVKDVPIVQHHLNALEKELNLLGESVAKLETALAPILIIPDTAKDGVQQKPVPIPVPLANSVQELAEQVSRIRQNVDWITSRVEV